jgi:hypothetical protein
MSEYGYESMAYGGDPSNDSGYGAGQPGSQQQSAEPKWFRDRMEQLAQQNKALADQVQALTAERTAAQVADAFQAAGVNPAAAALYQGDPGKVGEWLEANKGLLAPVQASSAAAEKAAEPAVSPAQQAAVQQMQSVGIGPGVAGALGSDDELAAALRATSNPTEFLQVAQAAGWQYTADNMGF